MKKILYSFVAVLFAAIAATSCSKEANVPQAQDDNLVAVTIIAGNPEAESATKTEIVGTTPYWSVGDKIGVSDGNSEDINYQFATAITVPSVSASFSGTASEGSYYAYYPYSANGIGEVPSGSGNYGAKVDLPANQYPTATSFDGKADVMLSKQFDVIVDNPTIVDLEFARLGAVVKIVLVDSESVMSSQHPSTVSMTASSDLAGRVLVNMKDQSLGAPYYNQSKTVTANYTSETEYEINGTNATYLIVVPQTLEAGSTLTIEASTEGYSIEKEITIPVGGIKLEAGKITTLEIGLGASNIKASAGAALPFVDNMDWANNGDSDNSTDISTSISTVSGGLYISGTKAYKGKGGLKLGTGSANGSITTKELDLSGAFYIAIKSGKYGSDAGNLVVVVNETEVINDAFGSTSYVNIPAGTYTNKSKVTIKTSSKRGYLYDVKIKSGTYVAPPVINVTSEKTMDVANTASSQTITYEVTNPVLGKSISAATEATWITEISTATNGKVTFNVAAQAPAAPARSAEITLSYEGAADVEVTVNQEAYSMPGAKSWKATALAEINEEDVFVIVSKKADKYYAMSNDKGTSKAPAAVSVTVSDTEITSAVADNIKWNLTKDNDKYTFYPNGDTEKWLYCTNTNNGVRVGTNANKIFQIKESYLFNKDTSRYLGVYNEQDWRCYTSINANIQGQTFTFYVYR